MMKKLLPSSLLKLNRQQLRSSQGFLLIGKKSSFTESDKHSIDNLALKDGIQMMRTFSSGTRNDFRVSSVLKNSQHQPTDLEKAIFAEKQELFRKALLESVINKGNKDTRFYWACFSALASFGTLGFEVLFRMLEIPFMGLGYGALLIAYILFNRSASMLSSGSNIAASMGGIEILPNSSNPEHARVYGMVEEITKSVQLKSIPKVYWIECDEPNAFASGYSINRSCITVTKGLTSILNDDELKSVIGHEMGHILNSDVQTSTLIAGMISAFGIAVDLSRHLKSDKNRSSNNTKSSSNSKGKDNSQAIIGLIILLSYVTMLAGKLLSVAVSRHREYAADGIAGALTHPYYIRDALRKISNQHNKPTFSSMSKLPTSDSTNHLMFFEKEGLASLLSTHPSLDERLSNLDKLASFDVEDFRKLAKVSVMRDSRAKNTILGIMFVYCLFIVFLIYHIGEEVVLTHLNQAPEDISKLFAQGPTYCKEMMTKTWNSILALISKP